MKELSKGSKYELRNLINEQSTGQQLLFAKFAPESPGSKNLVPVHDGTTNEEVLKVLITRMKFQSEKLSDRYTKSAIKSLESALKQLYKRSEKRKKRGVEGTLKR